MRRYALKRLLQAIPTLLGVSVLVFMLIHIAPGSPVRIIAGQTQDPELIADLREQLWLDRPLHIQYLHWLDRAVFHFDLGNSFTVQSGTPVTDLLLQRLPVTLQLTVMSMAVAIAIAVPAGIVSAVKQDELSDHVARVIALTGISIPDFYLGILLIVLFAVYFTFPWATGGYTPPGEDLTDNLLRMSLPAITLGTAYSAIVMRMMRSSMLDVLNKEYIQVARAMGVGDLRVVLVDATKNALIPVVTVIGLALGRLLNGAVLTETVFRMPGVGRLVITSVFRRDYPVIQGVVLFIAVIYVFANLAVDLTYAYLNPRIRYGGEE
jgi:peptide/nickel transport system permease protein